MRTLMASLVALLMAAAPAAAANKTYSAERFDSRIRILPSGAIEVVETVVFRFEGEFTHVFRELPTRRTDAHRHRQRGDGRPGIALWQGAGPGRGSSDSQKCASSGDSPRSLTRPTRSCSLTSSRGVVQRQNGRDVLDWVALPAEHDYRIDQSEVVLELPAAPVVRPAINTKRVAEMTLEPGSQRVQILASGIGKNGWLSARVEFDEGAIIAAAPAWQQRHIAAQALAPRWMTAAGLVFAVGLVFLFALRQRYDSPRGTGSTGATVEDATRYAAARGRRRGRVERRRHAAACHGHTLRTRRPRSRHDRRRAAQVGPEEFHAASPADEDEPAVGARGSGSLRTWHSERKGSKRFPFP